MRVLALQKGSLRRVRPQCAWAHRGLAASAEQEQLEGLEEVKEAAKLCAEGHHSTAVGLLERAVNIVAPMGTGSPLHLAALKRLGVTRYQAGQLAAASEAMADLVATTSDPTQLSPALVLQSRARLFSGDVRGAESAAAAAVAAVEEGGGATPDTGLLGRALRQLGSVQFVEKTDESDGDTEGNLIRAARLGGCPSDQARGLSLLAAFHLSSGDDEGVKEAVESWQEALRLLGQGEGESPPMASTRAELLCSMSDAEMRVRAREGAENASKWLGEALKLNEKGLPPDALALGWNLTLLGQASLLADQAVTSEGLLRAALDKLEASSRGASLHPSPCRPFALAATLEIYSGLLSRWEGREPEGEATKERAEGLAKELPFRLPKGTSHQMLMLEDDPWAVSSDPET
ncbi:unnamed protein product [Chrysoparadoxa australica]